MDTVFRRTEKWLKKLFKKKPVAETEKNYSLFNYEQNLQSWFANGWLLSFVSTIDYNEDHPDFKLPIITTVLFLRIQRRK